MAGQVTKHGAVAVYYYDGEHGAGKALKGDERSSEWGLSMVVLNR